MKVLVYGSGVIGCYLAHVLCTAGNDVALLARGQWKEQLQQNGLRIRHHLQRKTTLDHPKIIGGIEEGTEPLKDFRSSMIARSRSSSASATSSTCGSRHKGRETRTPTG
jgi:2-polyprenyl-6-methoxyphenol hydroxylase-like FAD-dependent oxidoreductase